MLGATPQIKLPTSKMKITKRSRHALESNVGGGAKRQKAGLTDPFSGKNSENLAIDQDEACLGQEIGRNNPSEVVQRVKLRSKFGQSGGYRLCEIRTRRRESRYSQTMVLSSATRRTDLEITYARSNSPFRAFQENSQ